VPATRQGRSSQRGGTAAWLALCGAAGAALVASGALRGVLGAPEGGSPDPYRADFAAAAATLAADGAAGGDAAGIARALHADNPSWPDVRTVLARGHELEGQA
jgi:hypothetical protein